MNNHIDSTNIEQVINSAIEIGNAISHNTTLVPGIPDTILSIILTTIGGLVIRFFEKRKMKKKNK